MLQGSMANHSPHPSVFHPTAPQSAPPGVRGAPSALASSSPPPPALGPLSAAAPAATAAAPAFPLSPPANLLAMPEAARLALNALRVDDIRFWRASEPVSSFSVDAYSHLVYVQVNFGCERHPACKELGDNSRFGRALMVFTVGAGNVATSRQITVWRRTRDGRDEVTSELRMEAQACAFCRSSVELCVCELPSSATSHIEELNVASWNRLRDWFTSLRLTETGTVESRINDAQRNTRDSAALHQRPVERRWDAVKTTPAITTPTTPTTPADAPPSQPDTPHPPRRQKVSLQYLLTPDADRRTQSPPPHPPPAVPPAPSATPATFLSTPSTSDVTRGNFDVLCDAAVSSLPRPGITATLPPTVAAAPPHPQPPTAFAMHPMKRPRPVATVHESSGAHVCDYCGTSFGRRSNLTRHVRGVHMGIRPFQCELCQKSFQLKQHLQFHARTVHQKEHLPAYVCSLCDAEFRLKSNLKRHVIGVHGPASHLQLCEQPDTPEGPGEE